MSDRRKSYREKRASTKHSSRRNKVSKVLAKKGTKSGAKTGMQARVKQPTKPSENPKSNTSAYFVEVDENHQGQRLDNFLISHLKGVPKTYIYRIIRKGEVRINKGRVKQTTRLELGDRIRIPPVRQSESLTTLVDSSRFGFLSQLILFEDEVLLVLNKPSGMAVHAGSGIKIGVIEALRAIRTDIKYLELVHRLDRETSGCLVLAKKASALKQLHQDFKNNSATNGKLDKRYLALVKGKWKFGERTIVKPLNTDARRHGERQVVVDEKGSFAKSIVKPVAITGVASLVEVKLLTGRTHQVRVHTQSESHPIAGDSKYGDKEFNREVKKYGLKRLFLHASSIKLFHPVSEEPLRIEAPLPTELTQVLANLKIEP